jgi:hypothetical protein
MIYTVANYFVNFLLGIMNFFSPDQKGAKSKKAKKSSTSSSISPDKKLYLNDVAADLNVPPSKELLDEQLNNVMLDWNQVFIDPKTRYPDWDMSNSIEKANRKKIIEKETKEKILDSKVRVDNAVKKIYNSFDLNGIDLKKLDEMSFDLAKKLSKRNTKQLAKYIRLLIIYLNTQ